MQLTTGLALGDIFHLSPSMIANGDRHLVSAAARNPAVGADTLHHASLRLGRARSRL